MLRPARRDAAPAERNALAVGAAWAGRAGLLRGHGEALRAGHAVRGEETGEVRRKAGGQVNASVQRAADSVQRAENGRACSWQKGKAAREQGSEAARGRWRRSSVPCSLVALVPFILAPFLPLCLFASLPFCLPLPVRYTLYASPRLPFSVTVSGLPPSVARPSITILTSLNLYIRYGI